MNLVRIKQGAWILKKGNVRVPGKKPRDAFNRAYDLGLITCDEWVRLNRMVNSYVARVIGGAA